jgi:DNA-binding NarL/FixJ family response regulator
MNLYRIVVADDHDLIRQGLKATIDQDPDLQMIAEASDGRELLDALKKVHPDMVILDISMPQINGFEALKQIHELYPAIRILVLTMHLNIQYYKHAMSAGAQGYLLKEDSLLPAIQKIRNGGIYVSQKIIEAGDGEDTKGPYLKESLTKREKEVLQLVVKGLTSRQIGEQLCISPRTVGHYRSCLLEKFNKKNSVDLVNYVIKNPLIVRY